MAASRSPASRYCASMVISGTLRKNEIYIKHLSDMKILGYELQVNAIVGQKLKYQGISKINRYNYFGYMQCLLKAC